MKSIKTFIITYVDNGSKHRQVVNTTGRICDIIAQQKYETIQGRCTNPNLKQLFAKNPSIFDNYDAIYFNSHVSKYDSGKCLNGILARCFENGDGIINNTLSTQGLDVGLYDRKTGKLEKVLSGIDEIVEGVFAGKRSFIPQISNVIYYGQDLPYGATSRKYHVLPVFNDKPFQDLEPEGGFGVKAGKYSAALSLFNGKTIYHFTTPYYTLVKHIKGFPRTARPVGVVDGYKVTILNKTK